MEPRRFSWRGPAEQHELVSAWIPGTSGCPFTFGHSSLRRLMGLAGFFMSTTPVTQALWLRIMGDNPAVHPDLRCPIENVSWQQITAPHGFLDKLNASDVLSIVAAGDERLRFRLPSEAEWEY